MLRRNRDDRGSLSVFVVVLAPALLFFSGLVIDAGGALVAKAEASNQAEQAARAGANAIDVDVLRTSGDRRINCIAAQQRVDTYLQGSGVESHQFVACGDRVTVKVTVGYKSVILGRQFHMDAESSASPICDTGLCTAMAQSAPDATEPLVRYR